MEYPLTEAQIEYYRECGYVRLDGVLTADELARGREDLGEAMTKNAGLDRTGRAEYDRIFTQKVNLWRDHAGIRELVCHPRLAGIARALSGAGGVRLWHDHALIKPHIESRASPWHQDLPYWPMQDPGALSCWLALDDVDETNGCMHFVPRSHTWGKLEPINLINPQDIRTLVEPAGKDFTPVPEPLTAGSCTFHNGLTWHYAPPNRGTAPRRALVIIYMPDGTRFSGKIHCVTDDLGLPVGDPIAGERFPVLA
jgi:ectoine hydroxylase-related dioxygenase (phytanoyl-CoA dioxygenase family)